jgi:hypothetical protein
MKAKIVTDKCHGGRNRKAIRVLSSTPPVASKMAAPTPKTTTAIIIDNIVPI